MKKEMKKENTTIYVIIAHTTKSLKDCYYQKYDFEKVVAVAHNKKEVNQIIKENRDCRQFAFSDGDEWLVVRKYSNDLYDYDATVYLWNIVE